MNEWNLQLLEILNVASRICDACKENNAEILITDNLKNQLNEEIETNNSEF